MSFTGVRHLKALLVILAVAISAGSLIVSHRLTGDLLAEEVGKMDVWAEAMLSLTEADEETDLNLVLKVINSNHTIPVVVIDNEGSVLAYRNLQPAPAGADSLHTLEGIVEEMKQQGRVITMDLEAGGAEEIYVYYEESLMLRRLSAFPYVQLSVVAFFVMVCIFALLASKRAEQNRVWVGLSRETAHQLGTPISSLMAWSEVLKENHPDDSLLTEMDKDVRRLQLIAERFSKIGSAPELTVTDLRDVVHRIVEYLDTRTSKKVVFTVKNPPHALPARVNEPLFQWVIENLCKNAVDAMAGEGSITISLQPVARGARIEVHDTGKGIPRNRFKTVFKPGFTTKKRGWGLGLSLAKRIVEEYHHGRIFVKDSEQGKGTTFVIELG